MESNDAIFEAEAALDKQRSNDHSHTGERASAIAGGGFVRDHSFDDGDDQTPLLSRPSNDSQSRRYDGVHEEQSQEQTSAWQWKDEFDGLPWWKRPSIYFILPPFVLFALAFGGIIVLKLNLILKLVCRDYYSDMAYKDPTYKFIPIHFEGGTAEECRADGVQSRVALFSLAGGLISGILAALVSPTLGKLSDRYGRRWILAFTVSGMILSEVVTIVAATYIETFPLPWFFVGFFLDGLSGSFITGLAIAHSYATDCTPPERLNVAFGYFHACLFSGIALGPLVAAGVTKLSGSSLTMFYFSLACHAIFVLCIIFVVPESLSKRRQMEARKKYEQEMEAKESSKTFLSNMRRVNIFEPLQILWPTDSGSSPALRRNLVLLVAIDTVIFGIAMGSMQITIYYLGAQFGWGSEEENILLSVTNISRVFGLFVILPTIVRVFRGKASSNRNPRPQAGCDNVDLWTIRTAIFFEVVGFVGYTVARRGEVFAAFGCIAAIGGIGSPTIQSAMTKHVPYDRTGQLLGATGLMHALARVVAPIFTNAIYAATVGKFSQAVFVCLAGAFGISWVLSWFLRAHVYLEDEDNSHTSLHDGDVGEQVGRI